jgi:peptide/nickel transport system permease protein
MRFRAGGKRGGFLMSHVSPSQVRLSTNHSVERIPCHAIDSLDAPGNESVHRITRAAMLEVLNQDYVRTARAKGLPERVVVDKHALANAMIPVVTVIGLIVGILLGGAVVVEQVFSLPGAGRLIIGAILRRDYPVIQGGLLLTATIFVFVNLTVDILYATLDPRVRYD